MNCSFKVLFICLTGACVNISECLQTLHPNNGVDAGDWGPVEYCLGGSFATGIEMKSDGHSTGNNGGLFDNVGATAFRLFCDGFTEGISSLECNGAEGSWLPVWHCPNGGYVVGLQINVNPKNFDKLGVENVRVSCVDSFGQMTTIDAITGNLNFDKLKKQERKIEYHQAKNEISPTVDDQYWSPIQLCSVNNYVCGLQTRIAQEGIFADNICLSDIIFTCCPV